MRALKALNSVHYNQNIAWDKGVYSLVTEMHSYGVGSNHND